jgi:hypothetical protein
LKILGPETGLWVEAIVFSLSPPSVRSPGDEACSGNGEERGRGAKQQDDSGSIHELTAFPSLSGQRQSRSLGERKNRVNHL